MKLGWQNNRRKNAFPFTPLEKMTHHVAFDISFSEFENLFHCQLGRKGFHKIDPQLVDDYRLHSHLYLVITQGLFFYSSYLSPAPENAYMNFSSGISISIYILSKCFNLIINELGH